VSGGVREAPTALIAVGGNSLVRAEEDPSIASELRHVRETCRAVAEVARQGWRVVLTHGNGPQVGAALRRSELGASDAYPLPLDLCVASTQAEIGFLLAQGLDEALAERGLACPVAAVVTRVRVSAEDAAFQHPSKPIGRFLSAREAAERRLAGWTLVEEPPHGCRRLVPSPEPLEVMEEPVIRALLAGGALVVAVGGGGVPVVREGKGESLCLRGVEAVVDKDLASALLAVRLGAERLLVLTDVDGVYVDFGRPAERRLGRVSTAELREHDADGHFPEGNMGPKVRALIRFIEAGGREAVVTTPGRLAAALAGDDGTHVYGD
jgi:carbamate kinase